MKRLIAFFSLLALVSLPVTAFSQTQTQTATQNTKTKPANLKNLPPNVQAMLAQSIAKLDLSTPQGQAGLRNLVLGLSQQYPSFVAEITFAAVAIVTQQVTSAQTAATAVGGMVGAVVQAFPNQALTIVTAAVAAVPNAMNVPVITAVVTNTKAAFSDPAALVAMLNAVNNIAQDRNVTQALRTEFAAATGEEGTIAFEGQVEEDGEADFTESPFALVTAPEGETVNPGMNSNLSPFLTGDQGIGTVGTQFPSSGGGGGSGSSSSPTQSPTQSPSAAPTVAPTAPPPTPTPSS